MSPQELQEFLAAMERVTAEHAATPEKARQFLKDEGFLDQDGCVTKPFRSAVERT